VVGTGECKLCYVCVLTEGVVVHRRVSYVQYVILTEGALVKERVSYVVYVY